jgi:ATP-grasp domain-containing protein
MTTFRSSGAALRALGRAASYSAWLAERTAQTAVEGHGLEDAPALEVLLRRRADAMRLLETEASTEGWVGPAAAVDLLDEYGLAPVGGVATGPEAVADLARTLGLPVAIKVADRDVVHRTERGLVRVGLDSDEEVRSAVASFAVELGRPDVAVLVQPVVAGTELAVGVVRDPSFGPLVMVGAGGVNTDLLADRTYMLPPVHEGDVRRALRGLRCWPLLEGFRGAPRADVDSLVELGVAGGRLAHEVPEVAEIDLNPVVVSAGGCTLVDVKLRLERLDGDPEAPRQLRPRPRATSAAPRVATRRR